MTISFDPRAAQRNQIRAWRNLARPQRTLRTALARLFGVA